MEAERFYNSDNIENLTNGLGGDDDERSDDGPKKRTKPPLFEVIDVIEEEEIDWLWNKRIPRGKLTNFDGDPGVGKSYCALALAARLSRGEALPFDREPEAPLRSLIISAEDGASDTIKPRLRKLGADMQMIAIPNRSLMPSAITASTIDDILADFPAALVVIDPILAYAGGKNTDRAGDVRQVLNPLARVAEKRKAAFVLVGHLNKSTQSKALYRRQGSIDFLAACRSAFMFGQDRNDPTRRLMAQVKASLGAYQPTLEYFIDDDGGFSFGDETTETADDILGTGETKEGKIDRAEQFIKEVLADGPMATNDIKTKAAAAGLVWRTVWEAKTRLNIRASKARGTGEWFWRLA